MNKPEWFELAEKDGGKTHYEVKRGFRTVALALPLLAISAGVVFAQSSNESPANAESATVAIASAAPSVPTPSIATPPLPPTGGDEFEDDFGDEFEDDDDENEEDDD
jgi:hypothetical protein